MLCDEKEEKERHRQRTESVYKGQYGGERTNLSSFAVTFTLHITTGRTPMKDITENYRNYAA